MVHIILVIRCELPAIATVNRPVKRQETWLFLPCPWLLLPLFRLTLAPEPAFRTPGFLNPHGPHDARVIIYG